MSKYITKLINCQEVAENTKVFYFEKPTGFEFKAGQHLELSLINLPETDEKGNARVLSIITAPHESSLGVATRMRDSVFKRFLKTAPFGTEVKIAGPYGSLVLHNDISKPAIFLIGGIGITPIRSIIFDATYRQLPHKLYLFYSNRRPEDAAFLDELMNLERENSNYKFIGTMTQIENSKKEWFGEIGYINEAMLKKYVPEDEIKKAIYYLVGPEEMVWAMRQLLNQMTINEDNIKVEEFYGY